MKSKIQRRYEEIERKLDYWNAELELLQSICKHKNAVFEYGSTGGCYGGDKYWKDWKCPECGKYWREYY